MGTPLRVLLVEDSADDAELLVMELRRRYDLTYERVQTAEAMADALNGKTWDIVISDYTLPNFSAPAALELLRNSGLDVPFIIVSGNIGEDTAVTAMKAGANDYLMKDNLKRLIPSIERELREASVRKERKRVETTFRAVMEAAPDAIVVVDREGRIVLHNAQTERLFGYPRGELLGQPIETLIPERLRNAHLGHRARYLANPHMRPMGTGLELYGRRKDGSEFSAEISVSPLAVEDGMLVMTIIRDITARKQSEARQARMLHVLESSLNEIYVFDAETLRFEYVNRGAQRNLGYSLDQLRGMSPLDIKPEFTEALFREMILPLFQQRKEKHVFETVHRRADGSLYPVEVHLQLIEHDGRRVFLAVIMDITARKQAEDLLEHMAFHDQLTDLPNRNLLYDRLVDSIRKDGGKGRPMALLLMDLDRFKEVNNTLGHDRGNRLLQEVGRRLKRTLYEQDMVARLGGDEFAVLLPRMADSKHIDLVLQKIRESLAPPFVLENIPIMVEVSIGVAIYPDHGADAETLFRRADVAMYQAKTSGLGHAVYTRDQDRYNPVRLALIAELRHAIEHNETLLYYQPMIRLTDQRVSGAEALVRWKHPHRGMIPPDQFIQPAEQTGLIFPLTEWVLHAAMQQCAAWYQARMPVPVSINLSARNLSDAKLPGRVADLLRASGVPPDAITFEITESAIMSDPSHAEQVLKSLHDMGIRISIDDFGTGYSSLSYLRKLPVDRLKVDKSFVTQMIQNEGDAKIVRSTIDLAHNLGLKVVAEGVETREVLDRLADMGCDAAQGYYMSKPLPANEFSHWLKNSSWKLPDPLTESVPSTLRKAG
ncbi:MAG: EAL domain-containing protein [Nitrospirota bacterium]